MQKSYVDASVNFIKETQVGKIEARFVQRTNDYFIAYLSAQTGCNKACRMCHLTQTGQTSFQDVSLEELLEQAEVVLSYHDRNPSTAKIVSYNFMARGEPLASSLLLKNGNEVISALAEKARSRNLEWNVKISTIMPQEMGNLALSEVFPLLRPEIYYSLYSTNDKFRTRWLPKSLPLRVALNKLADWQELTRKIPVIHWAYIEGENDSVYETEKICQVINEIGLRVDVNIVRYNPFSEKTGREPSQQVINRNAEILRTNLPGSRVQVVTRVGPDVHASCGMFVDKNGN